MTALALSFQNTEFNVVDRDGFPWLRGSQIGDALGYAKAGRISIDKLYKSNADEFTDSMTAVIKLPDLNPQNGDSGQMRDVRIFSLRGCHLLAMFARTPIAKEFRKWVLDVLDKEVEKQTPYGLKQLPETKTQKALPGGLTLDQQDTIKAMVKANAEALPKERWEGATKKQWAAIKKKFGCSYKEVSPDNFVNIISLLSRLPLEGELLDAEPKPADNSITISLNGGASMITLIFEGKADTRGRYVVDWFDKAVTITPVSKSTFTAASGELAKLISEPGGAIALNDLPGIIKAASDRIGDSLAFNARRAFTTNG